MGLMYAVCRKCDKQKYYTNFYKRADTKTRYQICIECSRAYQSRRRKELPDYERARYLRKYGLTILNYKRMLKEQNGLCAICFGKQTRALSVDHHHASGNVRELLCGSCNALIGLCKERPEVLRRAIDYLWKHRVDKCAIAS